VIREKYRVATQYGWVVRTFLVEHWQVRPSMNNVPDPGLSLHIVQPSPSLRPYISAYYVSEIDSAEPITDLSVPEWGNIRLIYAGGFAVHSGDAAGQFVSEPIVQGPSSRAVRFTLQHCSMVGIGLLPAGFAKFWNTDLGRIADKSEPLASVMGSAAASLVRAVGSAASADEKFRIVDAQMLELLGEQRRNDASDVVMQVHALLNDPAIAHMEQLADAIGRSPASLARFCKKRFGFPPKLLLRRQRFLRMLDALHARPYAEWPDFLDPQYTDQSHMIRDFHYFMDLSPTHYLALPRMVQKSSAMLRSQVLGSALQGLA
jgi:AraC-like DNA-binding protein